MLLYHGTSDRVAKLALSEGLKTRSSTKAHSHWKHTVVSNRKCIYLTDAYPLYFAINAYDSDNGELPAVVEINTDRIKANMVPDEDVIEQGNRGHDDLPSHWDMKTRTRFYRERLRNFSHAWETSVKFMGTCAHWGNIPPEAITRIAIVDPKAQNSLIWASMDPSITLMNYKFVGNKYRAMTKWLFGLPWEDEFKDDPLENYPNPPAGFIPPSQWLRNLSREGITLITNEKAR